MTDLTELKKGVIVRGKTTIIGYDRLQQLGSMFERTIYVLLLLLPEETDQSFAPHVQN